MQDGAGTVAQPFSEHLRELRQRLIYVAIALFIGCIAGYFLHEQLFHIITRPLNAKLYYTSPTGAFNAIIKISIVFGVILAVPVFIYQLGKFLSPAFKHRVLASRVIILSTFLALMGVFFAYFVSLPASLEFLAKIGGSDLQSLITVNEYLSFAFAYVLGFAILFQLPLILLFVNRIKPQSPRRLMRYQRWVILISFILAAILTPTPDPVNQTIMAVPIILLYQVSVGLIWFANRKNKYVAEESEPAAPMPTAQEPAPYSAESYNAPAAFSAPLVGASAIAPGSEPQLIMDVFRAPQNPTT